MTGHILFVIYESGGTLTFLKCIIFQNLNLGVTVGLFYSSLILNDGAMDAGGNCIRRGSSIITAQRQFRQHCARAFHVTIVGFLYPQT
jgi:hypothetical protein